jgi:hypothetical protein
LIARTPTENCGPVKHVSGHTFIRAIPPQKISKIKSRYPEPRFMKALFLERLSRGEGPSASFEMHKHGIPQVYPQAEDYACSSTTFGMTTLNYRRLFKSQNDNLELQLFRISASTQVPR